MHDLVIRNGTIVDGSGAPRFKADIAIDGGLITAIGPDLGKGAEEIDATGRTLEEMQVHVQEVTAAVAQAGAGVIDLGREARVASDKLARLRGPDPGGEQAAMLRRRRDELDRELRNLLAAGPVAAGVADVLREIETLVAQVRNELTK